MKSQNGRTDTSRLKDWPIYVWLLALYPVLFLFAQNVGRVIEEQVLVAIGAVLLGVTLLLGLMLLITRSATRAGAVTAIASLAIFSYGHVYNLIDRPDLASVLTVLYIVLAGAAILLIVTKKPAFIDRVAPALNLITLVLLLMVLPPLVSYGYRITTARSAQAAEAGTTDHPKLLNSADRPDIYYIILDAYSANAHLLRDYGYDNSAFTDALKERGFYIADQSKTSYPITVPSLFSSLNMRYLTDEDRKAAMSSPSETDYLRAQVADNEVGRELQARGYTYVFMLSGYVVPSTIADMNIDFHPGGPVYFSPSEGSSEGTYNASRFYQLPFTPLLLDTTAFRDFAAQDNASSPPVTDQPYDFRAPERALMTWDEAEKIPEMPEATFTVIHIIKPHEPIAFDRDGNVVTPYPTWETPDIQDRFFAQLEFTNKRTLQMIDTILDRSSVPPIIILQSDHGSHLGSPVSRNGRRIYYEILNAYHFPDRSDCNPAQDIIPINSFRVVFNCYFGGSYPLLDAKYYEFPKGYNELFDYKEIDMKAWEAAHGISQSTAP
jgi:hypothetical protein